MIGVCELYITGGNVDPCLEVWTYKEEGKRLTRDDRPHGLINVARTKKLTGEVHGKDGASGGPRPGQQRRDGCFSCVTSGPVAPDEQRRGGRGNKHKQGNQRKAEGEPAARERKERKKRTAGSSSLNIQGWNECVEWKRQHFLSAGHQTVCSIKSLHVRWAVCMESNPGTHSENRRSDFKLRSGDGREGKKKGLGKERGGQK